jgi:hypothetical protein
MIARLLCSSLLLLLSAITGCSRVVGFECREGFIPRDGRCIDPSTLPDGGSIDGGMRDAAFEDADPFDARFRGDGSNRRDGEVFDGEVLDGAGIDGSGGDGGTGDGGPDAGPVPCELGEMRCGSACVRPDIDPMNCGGCDITCAAGDVCAAGVCAPFCMAPLTMCGAICVDTTSDPDHCGACFNRCASGICIDSLCSSGVAGHLILVGHDFETDRMGMNRIAGNSVFLASGSPVRALVYRVDTSAASFAGTNRAIDQVATERGRTWMRTEAAADEVPAMLRTSEVFVVYSQRNATDAELQMLGMDWSVALDGFLRRGGVVVVFDGGGTHDGTWQILNTAGLLDVMSRTDVSRTSLDVVAPADATVVGVPLRYRGENDTVVFESTETGVVVQDASMRPVVFHQSVLP